MKVADLLDLAEERSLDLLKLLQRSWRSSRGLLKIPAL
jgi:hypothetical protein